MSLAVFQSIGPLELIIVLGIVLLIFGPKRLPSLGRQLGAG
ncbi:MAG: twin-arginine translocase TatA/TatE family subunit, partial [Actinomycetota bacterium]|nr:twin-arginine translocase TatA/TatE family subunit [Actinomycetota bacterium]